MNSLRNDTYKFSKKNIIVVVIFFVFFGCLYAFRKGSVTEAILPILLGLVLFIGSAKYLARRASTIKK